MACAFFAVLKQFKNESAPNYDLGSLKTIRYGRSPIFPAKLEIVLELFGPIFSSKETPLSYRYYYYNTCPLNR
jgi:hypothetical protein